MKNVYAGIDIGGTTVKMALIDEEGTIFDKWEIPTDKRESGKHILRDIAASLHQATGRLHNVHHILGAGVGAPGYIDVENGVIVEAVNLGWKNVAVSAELGEALGVPVFADNDANLAAAGEKWKGAGGDADNLLAVTLGTGVGGGIIAGGEILHGYAGLAGEIGHITVLKEGGAPCNCGKQGCLETVSSATGIARMAKEALNQFDGESELKNIQTANGTIEAKDVFAEAAKGDELASSIVRESMDHLGFTLANLCNSLNPQVVVIGGGVSKAGEQLLEAMRGSFTRFSIPKIAQETEIKIATLGNDAGVIGAAWLAKQKLITPEASR
ncbi:ROK family glucokinase [Salisediminibacterium beveridgei]|uniref:ROK family glucokinase n=1 Tax=Salisediminibacterium beveridgei TaxID=632773 RepID=UPI000A3F4194|nr:ROK family glucokinase [Salisediminibacterium beveridgei]